MRLKAWIYLLLEANYADKTTFDHGRAIKIKRGQCMTSLRRIGKVVGCEPKTARRILEQFRADGMINFEIVPGQYTLVTICKYWDFQADNPPKGYTDDHTDDYTNNHTEDYTDDHTDDIQHKNNKNTKNTKKDYAPPAVGAAYDEEYGGPIPDDWSDAKERDWRATIRGNDEYVTREDWRAEGIKYGLWSLYDNEEGGG